MAPNGARRIFFLLIQTLPTFWAERILILRIFIFWIFLDLKFPDFWVPDFQISSLGPGLGPDAAAGAGAGAAGRILRSQPDPSPNAPKDHIQSQGAKSPCCDKTLAKECKQLGTISFAFWGIQRIKHEECLTSAVPNIDRTYGYLYFVAV